MLLRLILLFTLLPLVDFAILLKIGSYIGFKYTLAIVIITGFTGAYLAKNQGRHIIARIRFDISQGAPDEHRGLCVIVGGVFFGSWLITDTLGFFSSAIYRTLFINILKNRFKKMITEGNVWFYFRKN